jgi:hypothetical protein
MRLSIGVRAIGRERAPERVGIPGSVSLRSTRLDYARDSSLESFEALDSGVEHSLILAEPPPGAGELIVDVAIGGWQLALRDVSPTEIEFLDARTREPLWRYRGLMVFDATGQPLRARMQSAADRIRIHVDDEGAPYPIVIDPFLTSSSWALGPVGPAGLGLGADASAGGDINRDGFTDLIVSNRCGSLAAPDCLDQVRVHRGIPYLPFDGGVGLETVPAWTATGDPSLFPDGFGKALASSDVNGDGYSDVIVGAPSFLSDCSANGLKKGRVLIWYGGPASPGDPMGLGPSGTPANADAILRTPHAWNSFFCGETCTLPPPQGCAQSDGFGARIAAGDFNNDGIGDLAVGDPDRFGFEMFPNTPDGFGEVVVYRGNLVGPPTLFDQLTANLCATASNCQNVNFGRDLAAGDLDADQRDDLAVLAPGGSGAGAGNRRVWIYRGGANQLSGFGDIVLPTLSYRSVGIGDLNFDGFGDVVVGGNNLIRSFHGDGNAFNVNDFVAESDFAAGGITWQLPGNSTIFNEDFGRSLATTDVNGDCYADVGVGAPQWPGSDPITANNAFGHLYLFEGSPNGLVSPAVTVGGGVLLVGAQTATNVRSIDFEQNDFADLLISSPSVNSGHGMVQIHRGYESPAGVTMTPNPVLATTSAGDALQIMLGEDGIVGFGDVAGPNVLNFRLSATDALDFEGHVALLFFDRPVLAVSANGNSQWSAEKTAVFPNAVLINYSLLGVNAGSILDFAVQLDGAPTYVQFRTGPVEIAGALTGGPVSDCDGDGFRREEDCDDARAAISPAAPERCDGVDNNCSRTYDEGFSVGSGCTTGLGICQRSGQRVCAADGLSSICNATPGQPDPAGESCNNLDDDCDGSSDEGNPGGGATCSTGAAGVCGAGTLTCVSGSLACPQSVFPSTESCNGLDDDCDGASDEGNPGGGTTCSTGLEGVCADGVLTCSAGSLDCAQTVFPSPEVCNDVDDDCSGGAPDVGAIDAPFWYFDGDGDSHGDPGAPRQDCLQPTGYVGNSQDCDDFDPALGICNTPRTTEEVSFSDPAGVASVTLPNVTAPGDTSISSAPCAVPPEGLFVTLNPICVRIETTALFEGDAEVCITYQDPLRCRRSNGTFTAVPCVSADNCAAGETCEVSAAVEGNLQMVRYPAGGTAEVLEISSQNLGTNQLCALTRAFSDFAVGTLTDLDGDLVPDLLDNCPSTLNFFQEDGDFDSVGDACDRCLHFASANNADTDTDGRGDACECTDQNGDGRNTVSDLLAINRAIFNPALATPLCDGNNDGLCNVIDIVAANIEIFSPTNTSTCARQPVPGP